MNSTQTTDHQTDIAATRVLIVEDEKLWADMLSRTLAAETGIEVIGSTADGESAIKLAQDLNANAVVMDIGLAGEMDGIEAAIQIKNARPAMGIVILSAHSDRQYATDLAKRLSSGGNIG